MNIKAVNLKVTVELDYDVILQEGETVEGIMKEFADGAAKLSGWNIRPNPLPFVTWNDIITKEVSVVYKLDN